MSVLKTLDTYGLLQLEFWNLPCCQRPHFTAEGTDGTQGSGEVLRRRDLIVLCSSKKKLSIFHEILTKNITGLEVRNK